MTRIELGEIGSAIAGAISQSKAVKLHDANLDPVFG